MVRIIIICEGQTEQSFCNDILQPHLNQKNIFLQNVTIKKTGGGIVNWQALKHQVETHLKQDPTAHVTTLIDFYGIHKHHRYPNWELAKNHINKSNGTDLIEFGMLSDVLPELRTRFIPYIQLHEFEALMFSELEVYDNNFEKNEFLDYEYLVSTVENNSNPEMINDGVDTAPSKRLSKILKGYFSENENMKVVLGSLITSEIGLQKIRSKCPRFNSFINKLESL